MFAAFNGSMPAGWSVPADLASKRRWFATS